MAVVRVTGALNKLKLKKQRNNFTPPPIFVIVCENIHRVIPMSTQAKKNSIEANLKSLETILNKLEKNDSPLDDALASFESGIKLIRDSQKKLSAAEQKVQVLLENQQLGDHEP
jgi:exodeoxyribonuclease VII small subunit